MSRPRTNIGKERRTCRNCNCVLARDNGPDICSPCTRTLIDAEILTSQGEAAREVVRAYRRVSRHADPKKFLAALTDALDNLCEAHGVTPPSFDHLAAEGVRVGTSWTDGEVGSVRLDPSPLQAVV